MKLHRLTLTNYRGITHRDIEFPDRGVVVVSGPNETGKSSMLEALDLLLESKDRSTRKEVKQVKPTHADVGAEITAEISAGAYRFVYRKRFHKRPETELTVLAPRREQVTGDEAHDRVRAILAETVDLDLWQAQRALQSASTSEADLSGCNALSRALDMVAGDIDGAEDVDAGTVDTLLIDRIDGEFRRYFTATGRPTGEWAAATSRLRAADDGVAQCAAAIAEVDEAVRDHAALAAELRGLDQESICADKELTRARAAEAAVVALRAQLDQACTRADAAADIHAASLAALTKRRRCRADIDERTATVERLMVMSVEAADALDTAGEVRTVADDAAEQARTALTAAQDRVDSARIIVQRLADREETDRVTARLATIDRLQCEFDSVHQALRGISLTAEHMAAVDRAATAVGRAADAVEQTSAHVEVLAESDVELSVDGEPVTLPAGRTWTAGITSPTDVGVPGVLSVRITPGASAAAKQATLDAATAALTQALEQAGMATVDEARAVDQRRRDLQAAGREARVALDALIIDDPADTLRARLADLRAALPDADGLFDCLDSLDAAVQRRELVEATAAHQQARRDCETHRKVAEQAATLLTDRGLSAARAKEKLHSAQRELASAGQRLGEQREGVADEQLALKTDADAEAGRAAGALVTQLREQLAGHQPEAVAAALAAAERAATDVTVRRDRATEALRDVSTALKVYGSEGRKGRLDAAQTERDRAEAEHSRVQRRARAAALLRSVMGRHREAQRMRYVDPFRGEVERLGRIVFGESFEVDVDSELRIGQRTLSGRTVPYESLSGGAKEQLGIVARLAGAAMVAKEDTVPVVIDDALGFTDPDRLTKMAEVFDTVSGDGQVIILTCSPERYDGVRSAARIDLTAV